MKALNEKIFVRVQNAWGRDTGYYQQDFEIEAVDVDKELSNYLGHGHSSVHLTQKHIGVMITVLTDGSYWTCWYWKRS